MDLRPYLPPVSALAVFEAAASCPMGAIAVYDERDREAA